MTLMTYGINHRCTRDLISLVGQYFKSVHFYRPFSTTIAVGTIYVTFIGKKALNDLDRRRIT